MKQFKFFIALLCLLTLFVFTSNAGNNNKSTKNTNKKKSEIVKKYPKNELKKGILNNKIDNNLIQNKDKIDFEGIKATTVEKEHEK